MGRTVVRCDYITLEPLKLESVDRSEEEAYGEMLELVQSADGMERLTERLKEQLRLGEARARCRPRAAPTKPQRKQASGVLELMSADGSRQSRQVTPCLSVYWQVCNPYEIEVN